MSQTGARQDVCGVVLLREDGAALLQLRDDKPGISDPGLWVFPGGHLEFDELPEAAARREFLEESGYVCRELKPLIALRGRPLGYGDDFELTFFWSRFDETQSYTCLEGQALCFVAREGVDALPRCEYLTRVWDLALQASGILQTRAKTVNSMGTEPVELNHSTIMRMGHYRAMNIQGMDQETLRTLLRQMRRLRRTEEALLNEYHPADEMRCPIHFCIGQEAVPAALSLLVEAEDYLFSHHRSHGYYFAKGAPMRELFAEIYGRAAGANQGQAGSQDISHQGSRFYSGAILAGAVGIAVGVAQALQHKGARQISIAGFGEGATDEGAFWEAMNHAGARRLPVLFVCENNRYATYSDQLKRQATDNICERAAAFGVRTQRIFGNDVALVFRTLKQEMTAIREGAGPALVEAYTYRWNSHVGPEDDSGNRYRSTDEMDFWKENCPILLLEEKLQAEGTLDPAWQQKVNEEITAEIAENFRYAKASPFPSVTDWRSMNWNPASPLADRLLGTYTEADFNQYQPEAKLEPY